MLSSFSKEVRIGWKTEHWFEAVGKVPAW